MQHTLYDIPHCKYLRDSEAGPAWPLLRDLVAADAPGAQHPLRGAIVLGKFDHDLKDRPKPIDDCECKGNHPLLWPKYSG